MIGQKRARELFFLGMDYRADEAKQMGMVNEVIPPPAVGGGCPGNGARTITSKSPTAQRMLKYAFNLIDDGLGRPADIRR